MKKLKYILSFAILSTLFLSSCEDYLTKEIPFEELGYEPSMVLNARVSSTTDTLLISISKNNNYADASRSKFVLIDDVDIKLTFDGTEVFEAVPYTASINPEIAENYNYMILFAAADLAGKSFRIDGTHPDYPSISSEIFLPIESEFVSISFEPEAIQKVVFGYPVTYDRILVTLKDNADDRNFYGFSVSDKVRFDTVINDYSGMLDTFIYQVGGFNNIVSSDDPNATLLGDFADEVLFSDRDFNGEDYTFEVLMENWYSSPDNDDLVLKYANISEADFFFRQSYEKYQSAQDFGIFSEPVTLYSNIEGGLGIFSGEDKTFIPIQ